LATGQPISEIENADIRVLRGLRAILAEQNRKANR